MNLETIRIQWNHKGFILLVFWVVIISNFFIDHTNTKLFFL
jgi:hypothetical protein